VEQPQIVEKHIYDIRAPQSETEATIYKQTESVTNSLALDQTPIITKEETLIKQALPVYKQEEPVIHESEVVHIKPIILEKPIVHTEQEVIVNKPEVHENRVLHRDETIEKKENVLSVTTEQLLP